MVEAAGSNPRPSAWESVSTLLCRPPVSNAAFLAELAAISRWPEVRHCPSLLDTLATVWLQRSLLGSITFVETTRPRYSPIWTRHCSTSQLRRNRKSRLRQLVGFVG